MKATDQQILPKLFDICAVVLIQTEFYEYVCAYWGNLLNAG